MLSVEGSSEAATGLPALGLEDVPAASLGLAEVPDTSDGFGRLPPLRKVSHECMPCQHGRHYRTRFRRWTLQSKLQFILDLQDFQLVTTLLSCSQQAPLAKPTPRSPRKPAGPKLLNPKTAVENSELRFPKCKSTLT